MTPLAAHVEMWLRTQDRWVSAREICERFGVRERQLRAVSGKPGLLTRCAISHSRLGYKHVRLASEEEFRECDRRERKHCVGQFLSLRSRRAYRRAELTGHRPRTERFSGQVLLPL
jgi:hypothetical protein